MPFKVPFETLLERRLRRLLGASFFKLEPREQAAVTKVAVDWWRTTKKLDAPQYGTEFLPEGRDDEGSGDDER